MRMITETDMCAFFDRYATDVDIQSNIEELEYITALLNEDWDYLYACEEN